MLEEADCLNDENFEGLQSFAATKIATKTTTTTTAPPNYHHYGEPLGALVLNYRIWDSSSYSLH